MSPGFCIAHYRVGSKLGAGGMGEVWRATDTRLGRDVAIKILPEVFAQDADRMTRLQREAQVLASLNHPNIAAIYAIEDRALVLELVEGPTLAELIAARPLPFERALAIARQIAAALECAHERGIVHRDLKPANIKIQPDGRCKVLDFGLAKSARTTMVQSADSTQALTVTELGAVIGTPAYMAPEQARANPVDKRADIWAFGVVLFEMLTGQRLFEGASTTDILAAVLTHEPDWNAVPVPVRPLLKQCLQRDPRARLRDIGDIELLLKEGAPATSSPRSQLRKRLLVAALWAASIVLATMLWPRNETAPRSLIQFSADLGPDAVESSGKGMEMALSENGARLAYLVWNGGVRQIATRGLDQAATTVVPGTEGASGLFLSPDGQWVGFYAGGKIKKTPTQGGPVIDLCDAPNSRGAWWGRDGFIAANLTLGGGLFRLPDTGGSPERLTDPASTDEATHRWPQVLPGGDAVLFTGHKITMNYDQANLEIFSRRSGKWKVIQKGGYFGRYVPTGHLLYVSQSTLYAAPFDQARLEVRGVPVPLLEDVAGSNGNGAGRYAAHNGTLVYFSTRSVPHSGPVSWLDDTGGLEKIPVEAGQYLSPRISPDGGRLAISVKQDRSAADIFVCDLQRNSSTRLTFGQDNTEPLWTPDGKHIVYESVSRDSIALRWKRADGAGETRTLYETRNEMQPNSFSPDGRLLLFTELGTNSTYRLWTMSLELSDPDNPKPGHPEPLLSPEEIGTYGAISPDGRWVAYSTGGAGQGSLYIRSFAPAGAHPSSKWEVARDDSNVPMWSHTRPELFFMQGGRIMVVGYTTSKDSFLAGQPRPWLKQPRRINASGSTRNIDLAPDGKRLVVLPVEDARQAPGSVHLTVLLNFFDELKRRVPLK